MFHTLMLRVQGVLYDIANSNDLHFPDDNALWQVEVRLIQFGLQQELLEPLPSLKPESRYHLILRISSSICTCRARM